MHYLDKTIIQLIETPVPVWASVGGFLFGMVMGWVFRGLYDQGDETKKITMQGLIQVTVFVIWTIATTRAAVTDIDYPPLFLNVMFGAIVGSMNRNIGDWIIDLIKELLNKK